MSAMSIAAFVSSGGDELKEGDVIVIPVGTTCVPQSLSWLSRPIGGLGHCRVDGIS